MIDNRNNLMITSILYFDNELKNNLGNKTNEYLEEHQNQKLMIKYSASVVNSISLPLVYTAMITYKCWKSIIALVLSCSFLFCFKN